MFRRATQLKPDDLYARFKLALTIGQLLFRFDEALGEYRKALELAPHSFPLHNNIGFMLTCLSR